jgi:hypothetical protein
LTYSQIFFTVCGRESCVSLSREESAGESAIGFCWRG